METIRLYGCDVDYDKLYGIIKEAERNALTYNSCEYRVMLDTETGELDIEEWACGDNAQTARTWKGIDVCLWRDSHQFWDAFGDWFCNAQDDEINDFVRNVLSDDEYKKVEAEALEYDYKIWTVAGRHYSSELDEAVVEQFGDEIMTDFDAHEIIRQIIDNEEQDQWYEKIER